MGLQRLSGTLKRQSHQTGRTTASLCLLTLLESLSWNSMQLLDLSIYSIFQLLFFLTKIERVVGNLVVMSIYSLPSAFYFRRLYLGFKIDTLGSFVKIILNKTCKNHKLFWS